MNNRYIRTLHPEVRVMDEAKGLVEYVASDETIDCYREVIRADGWRFTHFEKNAPFVDSHRYDCIDRLLGEVSDFRVEGHRLIEVVRWAHDVADNRLAQIGWKMTLGGFLKAVSVGFTPVRYVTKWDETGTYTHQLSELGLHKDDGVRTIFMEQEQLELSACIIGANPNALAKAYKADALSDEDLETLSREHARATPAWSAPESADADHAQRRKGEQFLGEFERLLKRI